MGVTPSATNATTRFSDRVADYVRYRPGYPAEMLASLTGEFGLRAEHVIADIGSGTGISAEYFLRNGNAVIGVEPNAEMRAAAEQLLSEYSSEKRAWNVVAERPASNFSEEKRASTSSAEQPASAFAKQRPLSHDAAARSSSANAGFRSIDGTAERTNLPGASVDWVVAAQAFHWFEPRAARREFERILRPGGRIALIWNNRREDTPFLRAYEEFVRAFASDYAAVKHQNTRTDGRLTEFFAGMQRVERSFANRQAFDFEGLLGRVCSSSYMPARGTARYYEMAAALRRLFEEFAAAPSAEPHAPARGLTAGASPAADRRAVLFEYETILYVGGPV